MELRQNLRSESDFIIRKKMKASGQFDPKSEQTLKLKFHTHTHTHHRNCTSNVFLVIIDTLLCYLEAWLHVQDIYNKKKKRLHMIFKSMNKLISRALEKNER